MTADSDNSIYAYNPSHAAPAIFAVVIGLSLIVHIFQIFHYKSWRVTFFMFWGGTVFTAGWIVRIFSSYHPANRGLYIAQTCLVLAGPPIYAAAEYNILGRLLHYLPMHSPLHPGRVVLVFIYLGAVVESMTAAGASEIGASAGKTLDANLYRRGGTLVSIALVLQAAIELVFISLVATVHHRAAKARTLPPNVSTLFIMLYGTSTFVLIRCIFRAIESFAILTITDASQCNTLCRLVLLNEWYIYVFEAVPMAFYTVWLNIVHPGRYLPREKKQYLDIDGTTERLGPGWIDNRSKWETFADPFDLTNTLKGQPQHEKFWQQGDQWPVASGGSFAQGTATNTTTSLLGKKHRNASIKSEG